ncbi:MAG: hypothetical protein LBV80_05390 [Deltaproteobacteria bacterium]|jgi:flagellar basal-body rod modification protein FlgD|nr:hypothetical protein [Deltaproteobacteria bacterium]
MSGVSSILGQAEAQAAASKTSKTAEDKDMFLKLLVTQLTHQDPLNPAEDKEFIAQLAQFTQLEELQTVNENLEGMKAISDRGQMTSAVNLMGAGVSAKGDVVIKDQAEVYVLDDNGNKIEDSTNPTGYQTQIVPYTLPVYYSTEYDVVTCELTILDAKTNALVYSEALGPKKAGEPYGYNWSGLNAYQQEVANGVYRIAITGKDANGQPQLFDTEITGKVTSVENIGGEYMLHLEDGRSVKYTEVVMIVGNTTGNVSQPSGNPGGSGNTGGSGDNTEDGGDGSDTGDGGDAGDGGETEAP